MESILVPIAAREKKMLVNLFFLYFLPLDPDPRTQMSADPIPHPWL